MSAPVSEKLLKDENALVVRYAEKRGPVEVPSPRNFYRRRAHESAHLRGEIFIAQMTVGN